MNSDSYRGQIIALYLDLPDTPAVATESDWVVAADLEHRAVPLDLIAHAFRLATLRRRPDADTPRPGRVHSLAYFRRVIDNLTPDELRPDYRAYVEHRFRKLDTAAQTPKTAVR